VTTAVAKQNQALFELVGSFTEKAETDCRHPRKLVVLHVAQMTQRFPGS
jgi:hypothetical protein